jgi:hypothetical protein
MSIRVKSSAVVFSLASAFALTVFFATAGSTAGTRTSLHSTVSMVKEIDGYKNWTKVNDAPQLMPERVAAACQIWLSPTLVEVDGKGNPHRNKYFTVYVNDTGRDAMLKQTTPRFPVGTVIVKEKLASSDGRQPEILTVMIKRGKGFNPASGDWEYMAVNGTGTVIEGRGKLENCESCHVANKKTDYVFRTYLSDDARDSLKQ